MPIKRGMAILAALLGAIAVVGCGSSSSSSTSAAAKSTSTSSATAASTSGKTINVAVFLASAANTYWEAELQGVKAIAAKYPNVHLTTFDGNFNTNTQVNQLRDALVSHRYQAWFIGPNDGGPLTPTIRQAISQGVKVGCTLVPCGPNIRDAAVQIPGQVIFAGQPFYTNGQQLGNGVVQGCANINPCKVLWLPGLPGTPLESARQAGLYSVIQSHSNIHVVAVAAGGYLAAPALTATENVLRAHPDLNVIASSGDQMIAGAARAARIQGDTGKIKMYGDGCTVEAKQLILQGVEEGCSVYLPQKEAEIAMQALINAVNGSKQTGISVNPVQYSPIGGLGTKANIAGFQPQFHS